MKQQYLMGWIQSDRYIMIQDPNSAVQCSDIRYLDCKNWYDVASQILILIPSAWVFFHIFTHYLNLSRESHSDHNSQYQKSIRRKKWVNFIQMIYLFFYIASTLLSIFFFIPYLRHQLDWIVNHQIDRIYKVSNIVFINWLNALNITVGFLYWKAIRGYYVLAGLQVPKYTQTGVKKVFFFSYCMCIVAIVVAIVWAFTQVLKLDQEAFITLFNTILSIVICIGCRYKYRKDILTKLELSEYVVKKQKICSYLLLVSSFLRILLYTIQLIFHDKWFNFSRHFNQNCMDLKPYNALYLLFVNIFINTIPAFVYSYLFMSEIKSRGTGLIRGTYSQID